MVVQDQTNAITHKTLDNGLQVILKEVHHVPVVSCWVAYRIGSRNERTGQTGISHWVEHMMFKGTAKFPAGYLDRAIDRLGGQWNAMTSMDFTMYFETLPAEHAEMALEVESDRMVNAQFDPDETESERTVIISERQGLEDRPTFWLMEEILAASFRVHGYHHEIIGDMTDLHTMTRDDLYGHYQRHYTPSNAVVVAVGAFNTDEMLAAIERHYGSIPAGEAPQLFVRDEPPQMGERRVRVERPGNTGFLMAAYRAPRAVDDDWFKLYILNSVLTGPEGGVDNKTSRLYQALVKQSEIAVDVGGSLEETIDPYIYTLIAVLRDGRTHEEAEAVINEEIARLQREGITEAELAKAKKQARAAFAYATERVTAQARYLAQSAILGQLDWFDRFVERLEAVTLDDVRDVARRYLHVNNRTMGWLIPTGEVASEANEANEEMENEA